MLKSGKKCRPNNKGLGVVYWNHKGAKLSGYSLSAWQMMENHQQLDAFKE
jgi:hypothetical protein